VRGSSAVLATNWTRILSGGLVAGLVFNLRLVLAPRYYAGGWSGVIWAVRRTRIPDLLAFLVPGFVEGLCLVWIYAAVSARGGGSVKRALQVSIAVWLLSDVSLIKELLVPYSLRPFPVLALDLVLSVAAAVWAAAWYRLSPSGVST
jgi:hypothetical protein